MKKQISTVLAVAAVAVLAACGATPTASDIAQPSDWQANTETTTTTTAADTTNGRVPNMMGSGN